MKKTEKSTYYFVSYLSAKGHGNYVCELTGEKSHIFSIRAIEKHLNDTYKMEQVVIMYYKVISKEEHDVSRNRKILEGNNIE